MPTERQTRQHRLSSLALLLRLCQCAPCQAGHPHAAPSQGQWLCLAGSTDGAVLVSPACPDAPWPLLSGSRGRYALLQPTALLVSDTAACFGLQDTKLAILMELCQYGSFFKLIRMARQIKNMKDSERIQVGQAIVVRHSVSIPSWSPCKRVRLGPQCSSQDVVHCWDCSGVS